MGTSIKISNYKKPVPRWFQKTKKAIIRLTIAADAMIAGYGIANELLMLRWQLWCTIGIVAILDALEMILANGDEEPIKKT